MFRILLLLSSILFALNFGCAQPSDPIEYAKWALPKYIYAKNNVPNNCPRTKDFLSKMIEVFEYTIKNYYPGIPDSQFLSLNNEVQKAADKVATENPDCMKIANQYIENSKDEIPTNNLSNTNGFVDPNNSKDYLKGKYLVEDDNPNVKSSNQRPLVSEAAKGKYIAMNDSDGDGGTSFYYPADGDGSNKALDQKIKSELKQMFEEDYENDDWEKSIGNLFKNCLKAFVAGFKGLGNGLKNIIPKSVHVNLTSAEGVLNALSTLDDEQIEIELKLYVENAESIGNKEAFNLLAKKLNIR